MSTPAIYPVFDPSGDVRMATADQLPLALANGGKRAIPVTDPTGTLRYATHDQLSDVFANGGRLAPSPSQPTQFEQERNPANQQGFVKSLLSGVKGMFSQLPSGGQNPYPGMGVDQKVAAYNAAAQQGQQERQAGYSTPYIAATIPAAVAGANIPAIEHQADIGNAAGVLGYSAAPVAVNVAGTALAHAAPALAERLSGGVAPRLYRSAMKPTTVPDAQPAVNSAIGTALKEGIPVSESGVEKLNGLIGRVNDAINQTIQTDPNRPINSAAVAQRVDDIKPAFTNQVNAGQDLAAINASKQQFLKERGAAPGTPPQPTGLLDQYGNPVMDAGTPATPPQPMTAQQAQSMKIGTYKQLGDKAYGELSTASIEAQKALARGIKEELVGQFPELKSLNARDSTLYNLQPFLERAVARTQNHQLIGIGTPAVAIGAKAATSSNPLAIAAAVIKAAVDDPGVKSRLAIAISKGSNGAMNLGQALAKVGAYSGALSAGASNLPATNQ